jgi:UDP-N-acetylglucosamine--dolichyl-phosphate N-acetylglucosaminephosphotransferase
MEKILLLGIVTFFISFFVTFFATRFVIRYAARAGHVGHDVHKKGKPAVPELGGIAIAFGVIAALLFTIAANSFGLLREIFNSNMEIIYILAVLAVVLMVEFIGFIDDVLGLRHAYKFLLPFFVALPLMAVRVSALHEFVIPFTGIVVSPVIYELILIPIGVAAATSLTNTFAGFNGIESGMGAVAATFLLIASVIVGNAYSAVFSVILLGALLAFLYYNQYPARIFPDDVGTLLIGAMIASIVIVGGIELFGVILLLPHIVDFLFFKLPNGMPSTGWWGTLKNGKLTHAGKPIHLAQWVMKITGGITERNLVLLFIIVEIVLGFIALSLISFAIPIHV